MSGRRAANNLEQLSVSALMLKRIALQGNHGKNDCRGLQWKALQYMDNKRAYRGKCYGWDKAVKKGVYLG